MKRLKNKGFTLIELLVVVLIIGILAAVALPQYQKAVAKSRFSSIKPIAKAIKDAQEMYFNAYGQYAWDTAELDVDIPEDTLVELSSLYKHSYVSVGHDKLDNRYTLYLSHSGDFADNIYCEADIEKEAANALCEADGGQYTDNVNNGYRLYLLAGNSTGDFNPVYWQSSCGNNCTRYTSQDGNTTLDVTGISEDMIQIHYTQKNEGNVETEEGYYVMNYEGKFVDHNTGRNYLCDRFSFLEQCN